MKFSRWFAPILLCAITTARETPCPMGPIDRYREFLARRGRQMSQHAAAVLETTLALPGTFGAEDVCGRLTGRVSRATVYRTLGLLVDAAILRRVEFNGSPVFVVTADPDSDR